MRHLKLEQMLLPLINELGYELWACDYLSQGKHSVVRVYIDTDNPAGIGIEDCTRVSREVSALLDVEDPISGYYSLEVSSPGLDRPLYKAEHFSRFIGDAVTMKLTVPVANQRKINGVIERVEGDDVLVKFEGNIEQIAISNIVKANLKV